MTRPRLIGAILALGLLVGCGAPSTADSPAKVRPVNEDDAAMVHATSVLVNRCMAGDVSGVQAAFAYPGGVNGAGSAVVVICADGRTLSARSW